MTPDETVLRRLEKNTDTPVPSIASVLAVKTVEEVEKMVVSATVKFNPRNFTPIPPFLLETIHEVIESKNGDTKQVLIQVARKIKEFDTAHANAVAYKDKAKTKCKDILYWLYLTSVESNAIAAVNTIACSNTRLRSQLDDIKAKIQTPLGEAE